MITAAPACDGSASEAIAYASLEVGVSRTQVGDGSSDWSVSWRMPYAEPGACFSAAVELTDGTVIEGIYRLG